MTHDLHEAVILVDGSSYLYRAFHALPPLTNSLGEPTGAIYGMVGMLRKLLAEYATHYIAVIFDPKGPTKRHEIYPAYKSNRPPVPEALKAQWPALAEAIHAMGLPIFQVTGVEADDIIATLARIASRQGHDVLIATGDKDLAQLVCPQITLLNTMTNVMLDEAGVEAKFGVRPDQMLDYLALVGDTSDHIPGVPGVGPKTAAAWLKKYGSLDQLVASSEEIKGKIGLQLRSHLDQLALSRRLIQLDEALTLPYSFDDLRRHTPDLSALSALFKRFEFRAWLKECLDASDLPDPCYAMVTTQSDWRIWAQRLRDASVFALDTETTSLETLDAQLVGFSVAVAPSEAAYIPLRHTKAAIGNDVPYDLDFTAVLSDLREILSDSDKTIIGQNVKYDVGVLANEAIEIQARLRDTMLASYVLEGMATRHRLEDLALKYLGKRVTSFEELLGPDRKGLTFDQVPIGEATCYAAQDADMAFEIDQVLWPKLCAHEHLRDLFEQIECPLASVLSRMERWGVMVDGTLLRAQSRLLAERLEVLKEQAYQMAGEEFNLASPKQLQEILFNKLKLPVRGKTPRGAASTAERVLQELALDYPLPQVVLEHRTLSKLKSTYTDALPKQIHPRTSRVHTSYHQAATSTGRLSSTNPNLQNIPIRHELGRHIRRAFIAPPGYRLLSADYSQIELRIMAHLSEDLALCTAFAEDRDIHRATASEMFGVSLEEVSSAQRHQAKAINFGLIYGMSAYGLSQQLGISRDLAECYITRYFQQYPGVLRYMDTVRAQARELGYVETLCGRRMYLPDIRSTQLQRRRAAERAAINAPMQGTAADLIKISMIELDRWIRDNGLDIHMIMQVHDELVFEAPESLLDEASSEIARRMEHALTLFVPLKVNVHVGANWDEAH